MLDDESAFSLFCKRVDGDDVCAVLVAWLVVNSMQIQSMRGSPAYTYTKKSIWNQIIVLLFFTFSITGISLSRALYFNKTITFPYKALRLF